MESKVLKFKMENFLEKYLDIIFIISIIIIALIARIVLFNFESHDYNAFLTHWFDTLKDEGFSALKEGFSDYPPAYLYLLWIMTFLPVKKIFLVKFISVAFDFMLAFFVMKIVGIKTKSKATRNIAFAAALFLPTVILNGAVWAQCDVIYTAFIIGSIYYFMKEKPTLAMLCFSLAFSFKLQSIFVAPLLVFLFLKGVVKFRHFLLIPLTYIVLAIPALISGRSFIDVLLIYFRQYDSYHYLTLACPNIYHWLGEAADPQSFSVAGIMLTGAVTIMLLYAGWEITRGRLFRNNDALISVALVSSLVLPYLLPRMHERYFFPADIISLIWAFNNPKRAWIAVSISIISLFSYAPYLFGTNPVNMNILAIAMLAVIVIVIRETGKDLLSINIQLC